jgi:hypothetical protein
MNEPAGVLGREPPVVVVENTSSADCAPTLRPSVEFVAINGSPPIGVVRLMFVVRDPHQTRMRVTDRQVEPVVVVTYVQPEDHLARVVDDESKYLSIVKAADSASSGQKSQCGREIRPESALRH